MKEKCPYCLGLKAFCIISNSNFKPLYLLENYELMKNSHLCKLYKHRDINQDCIDLGGVMCVAVCPLCEGVGYIEWIDQLFNEIDYEFKATKEDFEKLYVHFKTNGKFMYNLELIDY